MIRRIRRHIQRNHTEAQARTAYAAYAKTADTPKPLSYRQWLAAQKAEQTAA